MGILRLNIIQVVTFLVCLYWLPPRKRLGRLLLWRVTGLDNDLVVSVAQLAACSLLSKVARIRK